MNYSLPSLNTPPRMPRPTFVPVPLEDMVALNKSIAKLIELPERIVVETVVVRSENDIRQDVMNRNKKTATFYTTFPSESPLIAPISFPVPPPTRKPVRSSFVPTVAVRLPAPLPLPTAATVAAPFPLSTPETIPAQLPPPAPATMPTPFPPPALETIPAELPPPVPATMPVPFPPPASETIPAKLPPAAPVTIPVPFLPQAAPTVPASFPSTTTAPVSDPIESLVASLIPRVVSAPAPAPDARATPPPVEASTSVGTTPPAVTTAEIGVNTESVPRRDRALQIDFGAPAKGDKAIQCNFSDVEAELEEENWLSEPNDELKESDGDIKEKFEKFINENTVKYSNQICECLMCGEMTRTPQDMAKHMTAHWGPSVLCARCGFVFESSAFYRQHKCVTKKELIKEQARPCLPCPHFKCNFLAISRLELYDHINEHCNDRLYKCLTCKRSFCTMSELRHHVVMRLECLDKATASLRVPYVGLKSPKDLLQRSRVTYVCRLNKKRVLKKPTPHLTIYQNFRCQICRVRCLSWRGFSGHVKRCIKKFQERRQRLREKQ